MIELPNNPQIEDSALNELKQLASTWRSLYPKNDEMRIAQQSYNEDFLVRMAYNSNAIEGSTLTLAETEVIYEGEFVPGKPGREQIAAKGIFEGANFIEDKMKQGASLDEALLRDLHEKCALDLQPTSRGMYRNAPAIIRAARTTPSNPVTIREDMKNLFFQRDLALESSDPLLVIPWFHAAFESIHPFADGNGRSGRLWMNAQLEKSGFPPICIKVDNGLEYKSALEAWQVDGDPEPFLSLFLRILKEELEKRISFLSVGPQGTSIELERINRGLEVMGILYSLPSSTAKSASKILGISERQTQRILKELRDGGFIKHVGASKNGKWVIMQ